MASSNMPMFLVIMRRWWRLRRDCHALSARGAEAAAGVVEAPNSKLQAPEKHQAPKLQRRVWRLWFDYWNFSGAWMLVLAALGCGMNHWIGTSGFQYPE